MAPPLQKLGETRRRAIQVVVPAKTTLASLLSGDKQTIWKDTQRVGVLRIWFGYGSGRTIAILATFVVFTVFSSATLLEFRLAWGTTASRRPPPFADGFRNPCSAVPRCQFYDALLVAAERCSYPAHTAPNESPSALLGPANADDRRSNWLPSLVSVPGCA